MDLFGENPGCVLFENISQQEYVTYELDYHG